MRSSVWKREDCSWGVLAALRVWGWGGFGGVLEVVGECEMA
jgi:hypothetical protein